MSGDMNRLETNKSDIFVDGVRASEQLAWSHKVTAGSLEIWTSDVSEYHATVEYYDRVDSHWSTIQAAVRNHGERGPVLQLTGPEDLSETQCRGVFVISDPAPFTIAALSIDVEDGRSALVQLYKADNNWFETNYEDFLHVSIAASEDLLRARIRTRTV